MNTDNQKNPNDQISPPEQWDFENSPDNYHNLNQTKQNLLWVFARFAVFVIILILVFFPYLRAEVLSYRYSGNNPPAINLEQVCNQDYLASKDKDNSKEPPKFKFGKIIEYEKIRKSAKIYCLYTKSKYNTIKKLQLQTINQNRLELSTDQLKDPKISTDTSSTVVWNVESTSEIKSLYWPIYY
jgi:hypothetical protein